MTAAALFLSLEGCLFDHPLERSQIDGRQWSRDCEGTWTETSKPGTPKTVRVSCLSEVLSGESIDIVQEDLQASVCLIMSLDKVRLLLARFYVHVSKLYHFFRFIWGEVQVTLTRGVGYIFATPRGNHLTNPLNLLQKPEVQV